MRQQHWLRDETLQKQLDFWRQHLTGAPALLELPVDRPRPPVQSYARGAVPVQLSPELAAGLQALSQRHGTTLFMTLLAGWSVLMSRLSGQDEVVIGTPVGACQHAELEPLIESFDNTLALRTSLGDDPTVAELLARTKATTLAAYACRDVPFEQVVHMLQLPHGRGHNPVFQAMLVLDNAPDRRAEGPRGLPLSLLETASGTARLDLTLLLRQARDGLAGTLEYASGLFDAQTIQRWGSHLVTLLEAMVANERQHIRALPLLDAQEWNRLLVAFNDTAVEYPRDWLSHALFELQVQTDPAAVAVVCAGETLTYGELNRRANRLAHWLIGLGVRPDDRVAICMERSLEMVVGLLGILKAGGAYVPLDPAAPVERLAYMLADSAPAALLTQKKLRSAVAAWSAAPTLPVLELDDADSALGNQLTHDPVVSGLAPSHLAYVIYTSGSTGQPKGVMVEQRNLRHYLQWAQGVYAANRRLDSIVSSPFAFDATITSLYLPLITGGVATLMVEGTELAELPQQLVRGAPGTLCKITPAHLAVLCDQFREQGTVCPPHLFVVGGEALPALTVTRLRAVAPGARIINEYGPTETTVGCVIQEADGSCQADGTVPIGRPIANTQIYVLDSAGQPVPLGVVGEICIGGHGVARGYLKRPELTAERFVRDPFASDPQARMYRTGDLGRWRADGTLEYMGRNDFQVKIRGFRIELGEIEATLARHPAVSTCAVVAREDRQGDRRLVAYVVPKGSLPSTSDMRDYLSATLPEYMLPSAFVRMDAMPLTVNGKLDRAALPPPGRERPNLSSAHEPAADALEQSLCAMFGELLQIDVVGRFDSFLELGGDSVQATRLVERIRGMREAQIGTPLATRIPVTMLLEHPTPAALAAALRKGGSDAMPRPGRAEQKTADGASTCQPTGAATAFDHRRPPRPGARLGRDPEGNPAWFIPSPDVPGKFIKVSA